MHKELKKFFAAGAVSLVLAVLFAWQCGWISLPTPATPHTSAHVGAATTPGAPGAQNPAPVCSPDFGCLPTQEEMEAQRQAISAFAESVSNNWNTWLTGIGIVGGVIAMWYFWRRYRRSKIPTIVDKQGKELPQPPERKFKQAELILPGDPRFADLTFDKVIGQKEAKVDMMEFMDFLQNPQKYLELNARMPRGVLLFGAPGTGKTLLVKALSAHAGIPVLVISGADFVEMFVGVGASRVRELYEDADALAKVYGFCIVFIDELDAVGAKRGAGGHSGGNREHDQTINQLLVELDGVTTNPNIITIGASNRKDILDPALLRPKRLDRHIEFFNPNRKDREELFQLYIPEALRGEDLDLKKAARVTPSASGSHIEAMANEAKIFAARWGLKKITARCLDEGILKVRMGPARDSDRAMMSPEELDTVKVHEGGHALVYWMMTGRAPERFTIIPRGQTGGHVEFSEDFEMLRTEKNLKINLAVAMGGWAATYVLRDGQHDTGISSDFDQATRIALQMVAVYGMSPMGFLTVNPLAEANLVGEELKADIKRHANTLLEEAKKTALEVVTEHKELLQKLIKAVGERETLLSHDFDELMKGELPPEDDNDDPPQPPAGPTSGGDKSDDDQGPEIKLPEPVEAAKNGGASQGWRSLVPGKRNLPEWLRRPGRGKILDGLRERISGTQTKKGLSF